MNRKDERFIHTRLPTLKKIGSSAIKKREGTKQIRAKKKKKERRKNSSP